MVSYFLGDTLYRAVHITCPRPRALLAELASLSRLFSGACELLQCWTMTTVHQRNAVYVAMLFAVSVRKHSSSP